MSNFWDDVDAEQMTHSDEPTTKADLEAMLAFADSVLGYQESDKRRIGSPVDGALNTDLARRGANYILRLIADVDAGERHLQSLKDDSGDIICDLEDQVKRLEVSVAFLERQGIVSANKRIELDAEVKRLRKSNRALARAALGAERGCPSCAHCQLKRGGHLA